MKTMALSREITLTIDNYNITLDKEIKIYEYDAINLCFTIQECGIVMRDGKAHNRVMPVVALRAYMLIETPQGTDSVEATNIVRNKIMFSLGNKYSRFVGTGKMQIILKDFDGCRITLPEFTYEVKQSINTGWDDGSFDVLITEKEDTIITDELGRPIETTKISEMDEVNEVTPQTYTMVINEDGNKKIKLDTMMESISEMIEFDVEEIDRRIDEMIDVYDDEEIEVEFPSLHNDVERIKGEINEISESLDNITKQNNVNIKQYGAIGDGISHKLSERFSTIEEAQKIYSVATSLNDEIDYCSIQQALKDNRVVTIPKGVYIINKPLFLSMYNSLEGADMTSSLIKKITNESGVPRGYTEISICMGFDDILHNFNKDAIFIGYHKDRESTYSVKIKNISAYGVNNEYGIYMPMSNACSYDNIRIIDVKRAYVTFDSWNTNMRNIEITNCVDGLVHENGENNSSHYWTGTSLNINGMQFSDVNNCISAKNLAYSTFNGVTCDSRGKVAEGTKVFNLVTCSGITFNGLGVEHQKPKDNVFYSSYSSVVINGLTFEAGVNGGSVNTNIFYITNSSQIIVNSGKISFVNINQSKIFNIDKSSNVILNGVLEHCEILPNSFIDDLSNLTINNTKTELDNKIAFIECLTNSTEALPTGSYTVVPLIIEKSERIKMENNSIIFPSEGLYNIEISIGTTFGVADKRFIIKLSKNNSDFKMLSDNRFNGANGEIFKGVYTGLFKKDDYINILSYTDTTGNTIVTDKFKTYINVCKI